MVKKTLKNVHVYVEEKTGMTKDRKQLFSRKQLFALRKQLFMAKLCVVYNYIHLHSINHCKIRSLTKVGCNPTKYDDFVAPFLFSCACMLKSCFRNKYLSINCVRYWSFYLLLSSKFGFMDKSHTDQIAYKAIYSKPNGEIAYKAII